MNRKSERVSEKREKNDEKQSDVHIDFAVNLCDVIAINYNARKQNNRKSMRNIHRYVCKSVSGCVCVCVRLSTAESIELHTVLRLMQKAINLLNKMGKKNRE